MNLSVLTQEGLISLLCWDEDKRGASFVRGLIQPAVFDPFYRDIAAEAVKYLERYKKPAGPHTLDLIETLCARFPKKEDTYRHIYQSLKQQWSEGVNREYVLANAIEFVDFQNYRNGLNEGLEVLEKEQPGCVAEAKSIVAKATEQSIDLFSPGLLFNDASAVLRAMEDDEPALPMGIKQFDAIGLGPKRKRLICLAAAPKKGKTWFCGNLVKQATLVGVPSVYVTCEVSEQVLAKRLLQTFFALTKRQVGRLERMKFKRDDLGRFTQMKLVEIGERPSLGDPAIEKKVREFLGRLKHKPRIYIKEFPMGLLTIDGLNAYLDGLESVGIAPGLLIVDYADIMETDSANYRHSLDAIWKGLRGIAVSRNIAVVSPSQLSKEGENARVAKGRHLAEDNRKRAHVDELYTYSQTDEEKELGLARVTIDAGREEADGFTVLISQAYAIGQFCMDSVRMSPTYWDSMEQNRDEDEEEDADKPRRRR